MLSARAVTFSVGPSGPAQPGAASTASTVMSDDIPTISRFFSENFIDFSFVLRASPLVFSNARATDEASNRPAFLENSRHAISEIAASALRDPGIPYTRAALRADVGAISFL